MSGGEILDRWIPEREANGRWLAVRYTVDPELNRSTVRERDVEQRNGYQIPNYFDTLAQVEPRCVELNKRKVKKQ